MTNIANALLVIFTIAGKLDPLWVGIALAVALVCAIVLFIVAIPHTKAQENRGVKAFLNFDVLIALPFVKFLYVFATLAVAAVFAVDLVGLFMGKIGDYAPTQLAWLVGYLVIDLVVYEFVVRLLHEFTMIPFKLSADTGAIRAMVGAELEQASAPLVARHAAPVEDASSRAMAPEPVEPPCVPVPVTPVVPAPEPVVDPTLVAPYRQPQSVGQPVPSRSQAPASPVADETTMAPAVEPASPRITLSPYYATDSAGVGAAYAAEDAFESEGGEPWEDEPATEPAPAQEEPASVEPLVWDCQCGARGNIGLFCGRCGRKRPF